ncbi:MAG: hypothetical protein ABW128_01370 [Rhizorhabdus sp.]
MIAALPLLPIEGAEGEGVRILVVAAAWLVLILSPLALARIGRGDARTGLMLAAVAVAMTLAATVAVHDAVSLPEVAGTLGVGAGLGYMLVRHARLAGIGRLIAAFMGLCGLGGLLAGAALWLDPRGLGLVDMPDASPTWLATLALAIAIALNLLLAGAGAHLLMRQAAPQAAGLAGLAGLSGGAGCLLGLLLGNLPMTVSGSVICAAAVGFRAGRFRRG